MTETRKEWRRAYRWARNARKGADGRMPFAIGPTARFGFSNAMCERALASVFLGQSFTASPPRGRIVFIYERGIQASIAGGMVPAARLSMVRTMRDLRRWGRA